MKKWLLVLVMFGSGSSGLFADSRWGPMVSYWDTSDGTDGYGPGALFSFEATPRVFVDFRVSWFEDLAEGDADGNVSDIDLEVVPLELGLSFLAPLGERAEVYLGGGVGYYLTDANVDTRTLTERKADPDDEFGLYGVVGFRWIVADSVNAPLTDRISVFGEAMYRIVSMDEIKSGRGTSAVLEDGDLDGVGANVGITLHW